MKRFTVLALLIVIAAISFPAAAQTITTVTGTVLDPNGVPYTQGTILPQFVNVSGGATPTITATGAPIIPQNTPTQLSSTGTFSVNLVANGSITPGSTTWKFLICSAPLAGLPDPSLTGPQCFTTAGITIAGASQSITTNINSANPPAIVIVPPTPQVVEQTCSTTKASNVITCPDSTLHNLMVSGNGSGFLEVSRGLGVYQGTTSVGITDTAFHALVAAASDIKIPANTLNVAGRTCKAHASGVYTNAAASLLNARIDLCTVSGCASGTDFAAAGCAVVTTNQANNLTNGQWSIDCDFTTTSTVGASGTLMAKALMGANLGAATTAVQSFFQDTATAVSAAVDETVDEFVNVSFKFSTSNAGNSAIAHELHAWCVN
jgi:hypothetical protein